MKKTFVIALLGLVCIAGCKNSTPDVDKTKVDDLAEKALLAITSDKPQTLYEEDFSQSYKSRVTQKDWDDTAKAYALRLGTMKDCVRTSFSMVEINDAIEAVAKYTVNWSKAPGTLEMSISKDDGQPWKIVKIVIRSDAISEKAAPPVIEKVEEQAEKVIKAADVKLPTGDNNTINSITADN